MKNLFYLVAIICIAAVCITSCTNEEATNEEIFEQYEKSNKKGTNIKGKIDPDEDGTVHPSDHRE